MRQALTYFFLSLLLFQYSGGWVVMVWFKANQSYIASTLCENRTRPQLHCNGKCYLAKKLKAAEKASSQEPGRSEQPLNSILFTLPASLASFEINESQPVESGTYFPAYGSRSYTTYLVSPFHPPCC